MPFRTTRTTREEDEDDVFDDWNGRDVDADAATVSIRRPPRRRGLASRRRLAFDPNSDPASGARPVLGGHADRKRRRHHAPRASRAPLGGRGAGGGHAAHRRLLARYGIRKRLVSYHAHNERARRDHLVARIAGGAALALVSDAGHPRCRTRAQTQVKACADACLSVVPIPGRARRRRRSSPGALTEGNEPGFSFIGFYPLRRARDVRGGASFQTRPGRSWRSCPRTSSSPRCKTPRRSWGKDARAWCAGK